MSKNYNKSKNAAKDFYKLLQVSSEATTAEIKTSYRRLALTLHPDRHDGDEAKTKKFKETTEAYTILVDTERRRQYDMAYGGSYTPSGWYNKNRKRPPPANYRKVYTPHAPPDGKWHDAQRHYDMHYGDGMYHDALKSAYKQAKKAGEFDYRSPIGKGFAFSTSTSGNSGSTSRSSKNSTHSNRKIDDISDEPYNPYSKSEQGPPTTGYEYEESYISEVKMVTKRRSGVVNMLHERRRERHVLQQQKEEEESGTTTTTDAACIIM
jgi:curved DNA-binding protein CbpA